MISGLTDEFSTDNPDQYPVVLELARSNFRSQVHGGQKYSTLFPESIIPTDTDADFDARICFFVSHQLKEYLPTEVDIFLNSSPTIHLIDQINSLDKDIKKKEVNRILPTDSYVIDFSRLAYRPSPISIDFGEIESILEDIELDYSDFESRCRFIALPFTDMPKPSLLNKMTYSDLFDIKYTIEPIEETEEV